MATKTRFDVVGKVDGGTRTPQGGLRVAANLTRVGVFLYHNEDGTEYRELRPEEEVFNADSLETLKLAPVTIGHPGMVRSDNYRSLNVGVVAENVARADIYVAADIVIQDADTVQQCERKDSQRLCELSCGYQVDLDETPGEWNGEKYDAVQRNIRYNHVGLGPKNWGRAGNQVRLMLDGKGDVRLESEDAATGHYSPDMTVAAAAPVAKNDSADSSALLAELATIRAERDGFKGERDTLSKQVADTKSVDVSKLVADRVALESDARVVLTDGKFDGMSDRAVRLAVLAKLDPSAKYDSDSDDYVRGRFASEVVRARTANAETAKLAAATAPGVDASKTDASTETTSKSVVDSAYEKMIARNQEAYKRK